ncbi:hypothetical protein [Micromonospora sp. C41]|uniref:hypothetical protein n=1 Tax=Micromonospora sp. C41 TaxID=2824878 RepID=UPI001B375F2A|nr:hypothetical protein [Micromonospora sp. C41]MBQ1061320.1 hypothetical protein [Micromonospora sp. C41]
MRRRAWGEHGCRRYGGCTPAMRCREHRGDATPVRVADLIARALAHTTPPTAGAR